MLRVPKILAYLAERLETFAELPKAPLADWLELTCNGQPVLPKMTLATIRTQMWRSGGDIVIQYNVRSSMRDQLRFRDDLEDANNSSQPQVGR